MFKFKAEACLGEYLETVTSMAVLSYYSYITLVPGHMHASPFLDRRHQTLEFISNQTFKNTTFCCLMDFPHAVAVRPL